MEGKKIIHSQEHQFGEVVDIILQHRSRASRAVNEEMLLTAWNVGSYVSGKLKSEEWGSKVVTQLSEYIRSHRPDLKGYSRSSIYNMVMFYDEYSSEAFRNTVQQFFSNGIVQPKTAQLMERVVTGNNAIVHGRSHSAAGHGRFCTGCTGRLPLSYGPLSAPFQNVRRT